MAYNEAVQCIGIALGVSMIAVLLARKLPANATGNTAR
jgi:DHA2 family multidrug resistance protein